MPSPVHPRPPSPRHQVSLSFYEKRQKAAWFAKSEERLYWEQWRALRPPAPPFSASIAA